MSRRLLRRRYPTLGRQWRNFSLFVHAYNLQRPRLTFYAEENTDGGVYGWFNLSYEVPGTDPFISVSYTLPPNAKISHLLCNTYWSVLERFPWLSQTA